MAKIYRFLGKSGRTTVPYALRMVLGLRRNDLVSFELRGDAIIIRKEKICDDCADIDDHKYIMDFYRNELANLFKSACGGE